MLSRKTIAIVVTCAAVFGVMQLGIEFGRTLIFPEQVQAQQGRGTPSVVTVRYGDDSFVVLAIDADGDVSKVGETTQSDIRTLSRYSSISLK